MIYRLQQKIRKHLQAWNLKCDGKDHKIMIQHEPNTWMMMKCQREIIHSKIVTNNEIFKNALQCVLNE